MLITLDISAKRSANVVQFYKKLFVVDIIMYCFTWKPVTFFYQDTRYRKRRQITGRLPTILRRERCINAGESNYDDPNYLHLCTFCTSRRRLPEDSYPTSVPEVYCSSSSTGCLGNNNGKCVSTIYNASLLRRKPNSCRLCMRDSQVLAVDEWEVYIEPIKVGCECMLDKNSDYKNRWFNNNGISNAVG